MNAAFRDLLDRGLSLYMDDVIIYTKTRDEHLRLLKQVFEILRANKLFVKISKCESLNQALSS
jgi:mannitol/fructose-specific phosphotransferase system IIA component